MTSHSIFLYGTHVTTLYTFKASESSLYIFTAKSLISYRIDIGHIDEKCVISKSEQHG